MEANTECDICGGTDFYQDAGYYFCNECQTQSQKVKEHVFQEEVTDLRGLKKVTKNKTEKVDSKITSWECYNIVMFSLTEQLINLGADKNLKSIVKCMWMKYLQKLEVLDLETDVKPKLQLVNWKRDSDILLGTKPKKRKYRKTSGEESSSSLDTMSVKRERSKKKKALVQAQYEEFSQRSAQESSLLHNETLTSLKSPSERSEKSEEAIHFNKFGIKELKKRKSSGHFKKHKLDRERHKVSYRNNCSIKYLKGINYLSPIKLYVILYLGLLIIRSQIQLGDFLRFIREGHLTFNHYTKLFPEEYAEKFLNIQDTSKNSLFSNKLFRMVSAKMAVFLNITAYIQVVDLTILCERFCNEMNLPDEVYAAVKNIISKVNPKLSFTNKSNIIPNYEGRAMSIILFTLKLLFGLDGVTEWEMSKYAQSLNKLNVGLKMFDVIRWMEYIGYRNLLISEHHFPSLYMESTEIDSDTFLSYIDSQGIRPNENIKLTTEMKGYKELLTKIVGSQGSSHSQAKFMPSLTPYLEYFERLNSSNLNQNFHDDSLDFLLRPNKYLSLVSNNLRLKHGGANDDWIMEDLHSYRKMKRLSRSDIRLIPVEISNNDVEKHIDEAMNSKPSASKKLDPLYVQKTYDSCRKHIFHENEIYVNRISNRVKLNKRVKKIAKLDCYNIHYLPYERYWLYLQMNTDLFSKTDFSAFFNKHTDTFKLVVNECARVIEQTAQELLYEFQFSELFLVFSATFGKTNDVKQELLDSNLKYYVNLAKTHW